MKSETATYIIMGLGLLAVLSTYFLLIPTLYEGVDQATNAPESIERITSSSLFSFWIPAIFCFGVLATLLSLMYFIANSDRRETL